MRRYWLRVVCAIRGHRWSDGMVWKAGAGYAVVTMSGEVGSLTGPTTLRVRYCRRCGQEGWSPA